MQQLIAACIISQKERTPLFYVSRLTHIIRSTLTLSL